MPLTDSELTGVVEEAAKFLFQRKRANLSTEGLAETLRVHRELEERKTNWLSGESLKHMLYRRRVPEEDMENELRTLRAEITFRVIEAMSDAGTPLSITELKNILTERGMSDDNARVSVSVLSLNDRRVEFGWDNRLRPRVDELVL